jgi:hypothetical protein
LANFRSRLRKNFKLSILFHSPNTPN